MESKKINQLATELAPDLSDLTIIGDPTTGISKKITLSQMASLFTGTVEEYANLAAFPITGVADTIYVAKDTNVIYRWDSTAYVVLSPNIIASLVFNDANGFDGTISLVGSVATLTITTALTSGSVPFIGASGALTQDNSNLFFDDTNNRLGIATASPTTPLDVFGSGIIGRLNATSTNNSFLGFSSNGTNKWSAGNVQSDHRFRIFSEANSAELTTILQTGEFGIGIANPTTKLHIDGGASALIANLDANVSVAKSISFRSDNSARINLEVSGTESGANTGAKFQIKRFSDAGAFIDTPFEISRETGQSTFFSDNLFLAKNQNGFTNFYIENTTGGTASGGSYIIRSDFGSDFAAFGKFSTLTTAIGIRSPKDAYLITDNGGIAILTSDATGTIKMAAGNSSTAHLTIASTGAATFSSSVQAATNFISNITTDTPSVGTSTANNAKYNYTGNSGYWGLRTSTTGFNFALDTYNGGTPKNVLTITQAGNVGIGVTPSAWSGVKALQIGDYSAVFDNSTYTILSNNVYYNAGNKYINAAKASQIYLNGGNIVFEVNNITGTAGNAITFTEAMRITSGGYLKASPNGTYFSSGSLVCSEFDNNTTDTPALFLSQTNTSFVDNVLFLEAYRTTTNNSFYMISAYNRTANLYKFRVADSGNVTNTNNSYGALSDIKLKENIIDATPKLDNLLKVKIRNFNYIGNEEKQLGVIAQELEQIFPSMIEEHKDFKEVEVTDEEGNVTKERQSLGTYTKSVKYSVFVPMLIKAIQEQQAQIEELKALINK
jgi:hypothetical protein